MQSNEKENLPGTGTSDGFQDGLEMTPEAMLDLAIKVAKTLIDHNKTLPEEDSWDGEFRHELQHRLMESPPEIGRPAAEVLERATRDILRISLRLGHPRSFGFVPSSPTWPGVLADFMAAAYNNNVCTWLVASGPSQLELVVIEWIRNWIGYPETAGGLLSSGSSAASVEAYVAAREAAGNPENATVYMSDQSHIVLKRAAMVIGVRPECIRFIPSDNHFRLDMDSLKSTIAKDRAEGLNPMIVVATAGTTSTGSVDPLVAMADYCEAENIWFHVDAAYGGFAMLTERGKKILSGIERADSITLDAHKWFFQPYEIGSLLVKDLSKLENVFAVKSDILQDTVWGKDHPNLANRGIQLSRSFRALKLWMSVQTFGMAAFRKAVMNGMELADRAEKYIRESSQLELLTAVSLSVVCFRFNPKERGLDEESLEQVNRNILVRIFWDDHAFMSSTILRGKFSLRICIVNHNTVWEDVHETLKAVERFGKI